MSGTVCDAAQLRLFRLWVIGTLAGCVLPAQASLTWRETSTILRVHGPAKLTCTQPAAPSYPLPPGDYRLHFGRNELGKPLPLELAVPAGAVVDVAVDRAGPAHRETLPMEAGVPQPLAVDRPHLLSALGRTAAPTSDFGVAVRRRSDGFGEHGYRLRWQRAAGEFRLERLLGGSVFLLASSPAPEPDEELHELVLQTHGFQLRAFCDDVVVAEALDGALNGGASGVWQNGDVIWQEVAVEPPVVDRSSAALVAGVREASWHAATAAPRDSWCVVELALDRPHPLVITDADGNELPLLQGSVRPQVLRADWRGTLGTGCMVRVGTEQLLANLVAPGGTALQRQVVLVRGRLWTPDGTALLGATPAVVWRW